MKKGNIYAEVYPEERGFTVCAAFTQLRARFVLSYKKFHIEAAANSTAD